MAGKEMREKRKKHKKSRVVIPADSGRPLAIQSRKLAINSEVVILTNVVDTGPNGPQHHLYARPPDACLDAVPDTGYGTHQ